MPDHIIYTFMSWGCISTEYTLNLGQNIAISQQTAPQFVVVSRNTCKYPQMVRIK